MTMRRVNPIDILAGVFVILVGLLAIIEALSFNLGSARAMGPGYFPFHVGLLIVGLGVAIILFDGLRAEEQLPDFQAIRGILFIGAGILAFSQLIERVGLVPAVAAAVFLSTLADRPYNLARSLMLTVAIPFVCVLLFQVMMGLQLQAFRWN